MTKRAPLVESRGKPIQLSRRHVPELLRTMSEDGYAPKATWNAVEALELLVEAGHFRGARVLAESVRDLVQDTPRSRLFRAYVSLCALMEDGMVLGRAREIESLYLEILHGGHSASDKARAAMLLGRALFVGVSLGVLPDEDLVRARIVLSEQLEACQSLEHRALRAQVGLELVKTYLHAPQPETLQARLVLEPLEREVSRLRGRPELALEVLRVRYHLEHASGQGKRLPDLADQLRARGALLGGASSALVELSMARSAPNLGELATELEAALAVLEKEMHLSGAVEALLLLADFALDQAKTLRAAALFSRAAMLAKEGGMLHALIISMRGSLRCALEAGEMEKARERGLALEAFLDSELGIGSAGLFLACTSQSLGDAQQAIRCAERSERFFRSRGVRRLEAEALFVLGTAHAASGHWPDAKGAWGGAVEIEDARGALVSAADKRAALAQAIAMSELSARGFISDEVASEVQACLDRAEGALANLDQLPAAVRSRAKILSVRAQISVVSKNPVAAVAHLNAARGLYDSLGASLDLALTDALTGLALLEVGKSRGGDIYEEAHSMLQQALAFFDAPQHAAVRWKLKYYLSISAYLSSQAKGHGRGGLSWREASASWLRGAMADVEQLGLVADLRQDVVEFSPGLTPAVLEPLKRALGIRTKSRSHGAEKGVSADKVPGPGGYIH